MTVGHTKILTLSQLVQAGAVTITLDGFHATGTAQELGNTPLTVGSLTATTQP